MTPVVKNLLIINVLIYISHLVLKHQEIIDVNHLFALRYFEAENFAPYQILTSIFSHSEYSFTHILFNMFNLVIFGSILEKVWGPKKFLMFYLVCGIGASFIHEAVLFFEVNNLSQGVAPEILQMVKMGDANGLNVREDLTENIVQLFYKVNTTAIGASGSIAGLLVAFWLLFPNTQLFLMFIPVPIKAKYLIPFFLIADLTLGVSNFQWDNIAHFAHLGGALFGFVLVKIWQHNRNSFY